MASTILRSSLRASAAATALLLATAAPADAAWKVITNVHRAKLQVCRTTVDGEQHLKLRLDNRRGQHAHRGGLYRLDEEMTRGVRVKAGKISRTKLIPAPPGSSFDTYVGEIDGPTAGGGFSPAEAPRC